MCLPTGRRWSSGTGRSRRRGFVSFAGGGGIAGTGKRNSEHEFMETKIITRLDLNEKNEYCCESLEFGGDIVIEASLGTVCVEGLIVARGSIIARAGSGIKAGEGIKAGGGIEAGEGIKAGGGIEAGEGIKAG